MSDLNLVIAPNQILREKTRPVKKITPALLKTISQMVKLTKAFDDPEGVGLAATQIGINEQFFIAKFDEEFVAIFNPKIHFYSKRTKKFLEGCLSIPDYYGEVSRPTMIKVSYLNKEGQQIKETIKGINAMIFQHEYDHLHGKLFIDYVMNQKGRLFKVTGKDKTGGEIFQEVAL